MTMGEAGTTMGETGMAVKAVGLRVSGDVGVRGAVVRGVLK